MTRMFRVIPSAAIVSARRLFETAVTPCDCSIENATTRAYDGSLPTSVMSVPCSVVNMRGGAGTPSAARICPAR